MNKILLFFILGIHILTFWSCKKPSAPEFREMKNIKFQNIGFDKTNLSLDVIMFNPNNISVNLKKTNLQIFIDGVPIGKTMQNNSISVPKKNDFTIPLTLELNNKQIGQQLLKKSLSIFQKNQKMKIRMLGEVVISAKGIPITLPIDHEEIKEIKF